VKASGPGPMNIRVGYSGKTFAEPLHTTRLTKHMGFCVHRLATWLCLRDADCPERVREFVPRGDEKRDSGSRNPRNGSRVRDIGA
jgi:hypothetical protein